MVALGVALMVAGILMSPLPVPVPVGIGTFLAGCAIMIAHSKGFRRFVQYLRHRNDWLSRAFDHAAYRAPVQLRAVLLRTSPRALRRHAQRRARERN
ncbi:MAG TPA: hypothetical protein VHA37_04750 [Candidatus Saccharimonadales bacterium]|nr:hypothetical protein [Candidatus Saccharimonadales bacterium]